MSDEMQQLGSDLIGHLLAMHAEGRLNAQILLLALQRLDLVPELEDHVATLRATVNSELAD